MAQDHNEDEPPFSPSTSESVLPSRRRFLSGAGAAALAGLTASACADDTSPTAATDEAEPTNAPTSEPEVEEVENVELTAETETASQPVVFASDRQQGVLLAPSAAGLVASFDVTTTDRAELEETFQDLSREIERLMSGEPLTQTDEFLPPIDSGAIGTELTTTGVAITVGVGASLFDGRFGLADKKPSELFAMPRFFNDRLVREELSHGDVALTVQAPNQQAAVSALHQVVRVTERRLRLRWVQEGYNQALPESSGAIAHSRNLMGFRDGTSNLATDDAGQMDRYVWVQAGDAEPDWAVGGTYQAVRVIRMLIEFWATAALVRQEQIFGRHRDTGAPLGQDNEGDEPLFASDRNDETIPRRAHMRLANPRTPDAPRILRRGFSYLNGAATDGTLDQGLLFVCYQRALSTGFVAVQQQLDGEPLEDYIKPVGGGLFFTLPGPGTTGGWLGQSLFAS